MKHKVVIVILAVISVGLAIALFAVKKQGEDQRTADMNSIMDYSNQVIAASAKIIDLNQVNLALTNDLATSRQQSMDTSNLLAATTATLEASKADLAASQVEIASLNTHITDLEAQNKTLDERVAELTNSLAQVNAQIDETRAKLAAAGSANAYLQQELQRQMAQKAELEHKFNDLDELRQQVKKVKSDMFVARRLQLMKNDNSGKRGAELLMQRAATTTSQAPNAQLNVEIGSDGSVRVIPPAAAPANSTAK